MNVNGELARKYIPDGDEKNPGEAFFNEPGTGVYRDSLSIDPGYVITTKGTKRLKISDSKITSFVPIEIPSVTGDIIADSYSFTGDPDIKFTTEDGGRLRIAGATTTHIGTSDEHCNVQVHGEFKVVGGSGTAPGYGFSTYDGTGFWIDNSGTSTAISTSINGLRVIKLDNDTTETSTDIKCDGKIDCGTNSMTCGVLNCTSQFIDGTTTIGITSPGIGNGVNKLQLFGTNLNSSGPHIQTFTTADIFPLFQVLNWDHDNISLGFDCYWDGSTWRSSDIGSNFQIYKLNDRLAIHYGSGIAQGDIVTGLTGNRALSVNTSGQVNIPRLLVNSDTYATNGHGRLQIFGQANATINSPSILHCVTGDPYPLMNIVPFTHNEIEIDFDCYRLPTVGIRSSSSDSNFRLVKGTTTFTLQYDSGKALGDGCSFSDGWQVNTAGELTCNDIKATTITCGNITSSGTISTTGLISGRKSTIQLVNDYIANTSNLRDWIFYLGNNSTNTSFTLPATPTTSGGCVELIINYAITSTWTVSATSAVIYGHAIGANGVVGGWTPGTPITNIIFGVGSNRGDRVSITTDGTNYYVQVFVADNTTVTFS